MAYKHKICCVYKIHCTKNDKIYVGRTRHFYNRRNTHIRLLNKECHFNRYIQNDWNLYGNDSFIFEIVEILKIEDTDKFLDEREIYWIEKLNSTINKNGYNLTDGGINNHTYKYRTEEEMKLTKLKQGKSQKGRLAGEKHHFYGSKSEDNPFYGKKHSEETKQKQRNAKLGNSYTKGIKKTEEQKKRMSEDRIGKRKGKENVSSKQVVCLNTGEIYDCISQAHEKTDVCNSSISQCCNKILSTAGKSINGDGYVWRFLDDLNIDNLSELEIRNYYDSIISDVYKNKVYNNPKTRAVICLTTMEKFEAIKYASEKYNILPSNITANCRGISKYCGIKSETNEKMIWMYYDEWMKVN